MTEEVWLLMKKIPTVLVRDPNNRAKVLLEVTPGCEWVFLGEGVPTRKYDGTCVMQDPDGAWWARREVKAGRPTPTGYLSVGYDEVTGKTVGWEPIGQSSFHRFFEEALWLAGDPDNPTGVERTFELCGPKINGDPERFGQHQLIEHSRAEPIADGNPADPEDAIRIVRDLPPGVEGIVWHHPDGRMAKLKVRDV